MNQQTLFDFLVTGLPRDLFRVTRVDGEEEISKPYRFEVELVSDDPDLDFDDAIGKAATLVIGRFGQERRIHGVVAEFTQSRARQGRSYEYRAVLVPRLWLMSLGRTNQVYGAAMPMSFPDIVAAKIAAQPATDLGPDYFELRLSGSYPLRDHVAQYDESDLAFISRLMEHLGIFYFFEQGETKERMIIGDSNLVFPPVHGDRTLDFRPGGGLTADDQASVVAFQGVGRQVPRSVLLKDYNYRLPNVPLLAEATVDAAGFGRVTEYNDHFRTPEEGVALAKIRAEELQARRVVYLGDSHDIHLEAGHGFALAGHFRDGFNRTYVATKVQHTGAQQPDAAGAPAGEEVWTGYRCSFEAIAETVPFRPERVTPWPKLSGIMHSHVDGQGSGDRAEIDEQGRYKVAVPFDVSGAGAMAGSQYMRMAQPHAGSQQGMHFPLRKDTEVVWACIDGDPDRPIILGAVPNPMTPSPVTSRNYTKNILRTASGIRMEMDDGPGNRSAAAAEDTGEETTSEETTGADESSTEESGSESGSSESSSSDESAVRYKLVVPGTEDGEEVTAGYLRIGEADTTEAEEAEVAEDTSRRLESGEELNLNGWFEYTRNNYIQTIEDGFTRKIGGESLTTVVGGATYNAREMVVNIRKAEGEGGELEINVDDDIVITCGGYERHVQSTHGVLEMEGCYIVGREARSVEYAAGGAYERMDGDAYESFTGLRYEQTKGLSFEVSMGGGYEYKLAADVEFQIGPRFEFLSTTGFAATMADSTEITEAGDMLAGASIVLQVNPGLMEVIEAAETMSTVASISAGIEVAANVAADINSLVQITTEEDQSAAEKKIEVMETVVGGFDMVASGANYAASIAAGYALQASTELTMALGETVMPSINLLPGMIVLRCGASTMVITDEGINITSPTFSLGAPEIASSGIWEHLGAKSVTGDMEVTGDFDVVGANTTEGATETTSDTSLSSETGDLVASSVTAFDVGASGIECLSLNGVDIEVVSLVSGPAVASDNASITCPT